MTKVNGKTANKFNNRAKREAHLVEVARLYLTGTTQVEIATRTGVVQSQISYDLRLLRERWQKQSSLDIGKAKGQELAKIDALELEYWQAWKGSKSDKTKTATDQSGEGKEKKLHARIEKENRDGDPRYLQGVQWCIDKRCVILGIDAPKQLNVRIEDVDRTIVAELARLAGQGQTPDAGTVAADADADHAAEPSTADISE